MLVLLVGVLAQRAILSNQDDGWFVTDPQPTSIISGLGVPLDDVFIHCRYAQNLLAGNGYCFNPGEQVSADTSPLWVFLVAIGGIFTSRLEIIAIILSALFYLAIAPGVFRIARDLLRMEERWAILAGVLAMLSSRLIWSSLSGMETILAALLALLIAEEHARQVQRSQFRAREAVLYGLGFLARPELALLVVLCIAHWIYVSGKQRVNTSGVMPGALICAILVLPYICFNLLTQGTLLPHSTAVQGAKLSLIPDFGYLWFASKIFAFHNILIVVGFIAAIVAWKRQEWLPGIAFVIVLPLLQSIFAPQYRHHGRYLFPILPLLILFGVYGLRKLHQERPPIVAIAVAIVAILLSGADAARWIALEAYAARNINDQQIAAANWINKNTTKSDRLAVHDVGAIAYLTDRNVIDLTGLVTPSLFPSQAHQSAVWMKAREVGANTFVIYNRLNPNFYNTFKDSLTLLEEFRVRKPLVSSADTVMSAYRLKQ